MDGSTEKTTTTETNATAETKPTTEVNTTGSGTGAKTEEELRAEIEATLKDKYEKEADKRVTDAQKKWQKAQAEKEARQKMSDEEIRRADEEQRARENAIKEHELVVKGLRLDVVDAVAELGLDASFRNLIAVEDLALIKEEDERRSKLTDRVKGMKALFDKEVKKQVEKEKAEFLKGQTPPASKEKPGDAKYNEYRKTGNVSGMIGQKLGKMFNGEE